jgi:thiol-disulfide isomerase/thioredoxin
MRRAALALSLVWLGLAGCRMVPEEPGAVGTPHLRALSLPWVGPTPHDWRRLQGQVVLVAFFATWNFPSLAEIPSLEALQREYGPRGFQVVSVGLDLQGAKVLVPFADYYRPSFPVLVANPRMIEGQSPYGIIPALPATFLLDTEGRVAGAWQGVARHKEVARAVEKLLPR